MSRIIHDSKTKTQTSDTTMTELGGIKPSEITKSNNDLAESTIVMNDRSKQTEELVANANIEESDNKVINNVTAINSTDVNKNNEDDDEDEFMPMIVDCGPDDEDEDD